MFERLRNKLTATYLIIFSVFLLIFVFLCFHVILMAFINEEELIMKRMLQYEADKYLNASRHRVDKSNYIKNRVEDKKLLVYLVENQKPLINQLSKNLIGQLLLAKRNEWPAINKETQIICIMEENKRNFYLVGVRHIYDQENDQARLYLFKDLTIYYNAIITASGIVMLLILFFIAVAGYIGYFLAGKNLAPIKESYQQRQNFIADASHELRTPLAIITMAIDGIRSDKENVFSDFSQSAFKDLYLESQRMRRLVNDLLTLARSETPIVEIKKDVFNLNEIFIEVLAGLQTLAAKKNIGFVITMRILEL